MDKVIHTFSKGINLKINIIAWLEFELASSDVTVKHINPYATGTQIDR